MSTEILQNLFETILSRKGGDATASYTAKLFQKGKAKIAQKVGEEAVETVIASLSETPEKVVSESADLLYHLCVLWAEAGVTPQNVFEELQRREGISGIEEKNSRVKE